MLQIAQSVNLTCQMESKNIYTIKNLSHDTHCVTFTVCYNKAEKAYLKKLKNVPTYIKCKSACQLQMGIICTFRKCHESYTHLFHCLGLSSQTYHQNDNVCSQTMLKHWHSTHYYSAIGEQNHTSL